jgi:hypothetical protein
LDDVGLTPTSARSTAGVPPEGLGSDPSRSPPFQSFGARPQVAVATMDFSDATRTFVAGVPSAYVYSTGSSRGLGQGTVIGRTMNPPSIVTLRSGSTQYWHVGDYFLSACPAASGWDVHVRSRSWPGTKLLLDGHFATEEEAVRWCTRMATVYAEDQADG